MVEYAPGVGSPEGYLDLTPYMYKAVAFDQDTLRVQLVCADGFATELQQRLKTIGIMATKKGRGSLEIARLASLEAFIREMDIIPSYRAAWAEYFLACHRFHRGMRAPNDLIQERRRAVRLVLALSPKLDGEEVTSA